MTVIILWIVAIVLILAFLGFLAMDDRNNQRIRAEEDRLKALDEQAESEKEPD
jgi:uncharacterized membrane protein